MSPWSLLLGPAVGFALVPAILAIVAIVDVVRTGADWWWILVILWFPVIGPAIYFFRGRGFGGPSHQGSQLAVARRTLRERQAQLAHWRGPGPLSEAGEALLTLGRYAEAEHHLSEALERGASFAEVAFPLAQALESQGKHAAAVPLLEKLCTKDPNCHYGMAQLALGRCLEGSGRLDEAEAVLRQLVDRRSSIEGRVRLARLLMLKGRKDEAQKVLAALRTEAATLPRFVKRANRRWLHAARLLAAGRPWLPSARKPGVRDPRIAMALLVGVAGAALVLMRYASWFTEMRMVMRVPAHAQLLLLHRDLARLDREHPPYGGELARLALTDSDVDRYLRVRRALGSEADPVAYVRNAASVLRHEGEGRLQLLEIAAVVEGRYLGRDAAGGPGDVSTATRAVLDRRHSEIERLDPAGLEDLLWLQSPGSTFEETGQ